MRGRCEGCSTAWLCTPRSPGPRIARALENDRSAPRTSCGSASDPALVGGPSGPSSCLDDSLRRSHQPKASCTVMLDRDREHWMVHDASLMHLTALSRRNELKDVRSTDGLCRYIDDALRAALSGIFSFSPIEVVRAVVIASAKVAAEESPEGDLLRPLMRNKFRNFSGRSALAQVPQKHPYCRSCFAAPQIEDICEDNRRGSHSRVNNSFDRNVERVAGPLSSQSGQNSVSQGLWHSMDDNDISRLLQFEQRIEQGRFQVSAVHDTRATWRRKKILPLSLVDRVTATCSPGETTVCLSEIPGAAYGLTRLLATCYARPSPSTSCRRSFPSRRRQPKSNPTHSPRNRPCRGPGVG